jgi:hypothetical protein
LLPHQVV